MSLGASWGGAKTVPGVSLPPVISSSDPGGWVWASTCSPTAQTVHFSRKLTFLGPPTAARVEWTAATQNTQLKSFEVAVNGRVVAKWADPMPRNSMELSAAGRNAFKVGMNVVDVRATRGALGKGMSGCNGGSGKPLIALSFQLVGGWATDLRPGVSAEKINYTHATTKVISQFIVNQGNDAALDGELYIYSGSSQFKIEHLTTKGFDKAFCDQDPGGATQLHCRFAQLDPGERATVLVKVTFVPDGQGWDHYGGSVQFTVRSGTPDLNSSNDASDTRIIVCEKTSTLPECKTATD